ncbi:hypothetical protein DFH08DRAFT_774914 [Mycena albidolilacea]|uniref:NAD(P)-binding protein n=1 Tax=Mycena albidolilacea TaxID=1033008 RepID=A0AAD7EU16_9AGAR|nr:hypothetical protein DFH08DRAFT_774914 [Mycena albidolilacea]
MGQTLSFVFTFLRVQLFAKLQDTHADLTGRTYLITGSNTGLGLALAIHLARLHPAKLILAVRDLKKGDAAKQTIIAETGFTGAIEVWELDMASFASVRKFAERANTTLERLDGAVLNAGINDWKWSQTAVDGWERILQVNALSTGLLGVLLLPLLQKSSKLAHPLPDTALPPHLTITGSEGMLMAKFTERSASKILETMNDESQCKDIVDRYATSKLFNLFLAREIAKLPQAQGVVVNVVAPGLCASELGRDLGLPPFALSILGLLAWTTAKGALNLLYGVLRPTPPGAYIYTCEVQKPPSWTESKEGLGVQAKVWTEMVEVWREVSPEVANIAVV